MTKPDKSRQATPKRKIRAAQVVQKTLEGKKQGEIAEELGIERQTVSEILNSEESAAIIEKLTDRVTRLAEKIMERFEKIAERGEDGHVIQLGLPILRTKGLVNEKQEHIHSFPAPTVVRFNGKEIRMGVLNEKDEEE